MKINFILIITVSVVVAGFVYSFIELSKINNNISIIFKEINKIKLNLEDTQTDHMKYNVRGGQQPLVQNNVIHEKINHTHNSGKKQQILDEINEYEKELEYLDSMIESENENIESENIYSLEKLVTENEDTTYISCDNDEIEEEQENIKLNHTNNDEDIITDEEDNIPTDEDISTVEDENEVIDEGDIPTDEEEDIATDEEINNITLNTDDYNNEKNIDSDDINTSKTVDTHSIQSTENSYSIDKEQLNFYVSQYSKKELIDMCKSMNISHSGNKETIIKRIYNKNKTLLVKK